MDHSMPAIAAARPFGAAPHGSSPARRLGQASRGDAQRGGLRSRRPKGWAP